jgi:cytochrome c
MCLTTVMILLNACGDGKPPESSPTSAAVTEHVAAETVPESPPKTEFPTTEVAAAQPSEPESAEPANVTEVDANKEELDLARKSGCMACHAIDKKVVGPAWKDVAIRYAGDRNAKTKLIEKVAKGGRGNWTEVVGNMAMPPYSPRVSQENIAILVEFVLSLNNQ